MQNLTKYIVLLPSFSWLRVNVPLYTGQAVDTFAPYVALGWTKVTAGAQYIWEISTPHREWLYIKLLQLIDQVRDIHKLCPMIKSSQRSMDFSYILHSTCIPNYLV